MVTLVLKMELRLPGVSSLKEKRRILKSMMTILRNKFNISLSEVERLDNHQSAVIGAALVVNDSSYGHQVISKLVNKIELNPAVMIIDYRLESY